MEVCTVLSVIVQLTHPMTERLPILLQITAGDPRPIGRQIVDAVRRQIATGELPVGAALPSVRGLAQQLSVNPNTVAKAYAELTAEGWLLRAPAWACSSPSRASACPTAERARRLDDAVRRFVGDVIGLDYPADAILDRVAANCPSYTEENQLSPYERLRHRDRRPAPALQEQAGARPPDAGACRAAASTPSSAPTAPANPRCFACCSASSRPAAVPRRCWATTRA
jgi:GntR family transcriptional regulator